jgi:hypothetical protein
VTQLLTIVTPALASSVQKEYERIVLAESHGVGCQQSVGQRIAIG